MISIKLGKYSFLSLFLVLGSSISMPAIAQLTPDTTLGAESSMVTTNALVRNNVADLIGGGAIRDTNLFHSFKDFNVGDGQRVYFTNPAAIANIITRITGNNLSNINGILGVDGNANLYLVNPNGISFGKNARLDIAGSFYGSTSDQLLFEDGSAFKTQDQSVNNPLLTVSQPLGLSAWLPIQTGTITNRGALAVGENLALSGNNLDLQNLLYAGKNLTLQGTSQVKVRDTVTNPFLAIAGDKLLIASNNIDLFALNHLNGGLFSGGDMTLRSPNSITMDTYFNSGRNFRLENNSGDLGNGYSPNDPIIRSSGDVSFAAYNGASLHIFAGGSVTANSITINNVDTANGITNDIVLSDGSQIIIDGVKTATLDIRAGTTDYGTNGVIGLVDLSSYGINSYVNQEVLDNASFDFLTSELSEPQLLNSATSSNISINSITTKDFTGNHQIFLSNQYKPNSSLSGDIQLENILLGQADKALVVDSKGDINITGKIETDGSLLYDPNPRPANFVNPNAGEVRLLAQGNINFQTGSNLSSKSSGKTGDVILKASNISLAAPSLDPLTNVINPVIESAGNISIYAQQQFTALGGAQVKASTTNSNNAGNILVNADTILLDGISSTGVFSGLSSLVKNGASGNGGTIEVIAKNLSINNGAQIKNSTSGIGNAGIVKISTTDALSINGAVQDPTLSKELAVSGIFSEVTPTGTGSGQTINITTKNLSVTNGGNISGATSGVGNAGDVFIKATGLVSFDGLASINGNVRRSGAFVGTRTINGSPALNTIGQGGNLTVNAADLSITNGAHLDALTETGNNAGSITINTSKNINISGIDSGTFANTTQGSSGNGGSILTNSQNLFVTNGGTISSSTAGKGKAGDIALNTLETASFNGLNSGTFTESKSTAFGAGGNLTVNAADLNITNGAQLRATTASSQNAGNVKINVSGDINVDGENTGIFANTTQGSAGNGGNIDIDPINIRLSNGGGFFVDSLGSGIGGDIRVVGDYLFLNKGLISAATASNLGGNITLEIGKLLTFINGSAITATAGTAGSGGNGGNILITSPFIIAFPDQMNFITANAFTGNGGNINISTQSIFGAKYLNISASSQFGLDGSVVIDSPDVDPTSGLAKLATNLNNPNDKVVQACSSSDVNSYTITGRGGLAEDPSTTLRGRSVLADLRDFSQLSASEQQPSLKQAQLETPVRIEQATSLILNEQHKPELIASHDYEMKEKTSFNCY